MAFRITRLVDAALARWRRRDDRQTEQMQATARPFLVGIAVDETRTQLIITGADGLLARAEARVLLVGRKSHVVVPVPLGVSSGDGSATVDENDLAAFGSETVDVYLDTVTADGKPTRRRLAAESSVLPAQAGSSRRWYVTAEGNLSVRRPTAVEIIEDAGVFDVAYYRQQTADLPDDADPIEHYVARGAAENLNPSTMFDTAYYRKMVPAARRQNPLVHYCERGWQELFNPSPRFNTWWYWATHLDLADHSRNPLAHYEAVGKHARLTTTPEPYPSRRLGAGQRLGQGDPVRRVCLFAGWDPDGILDEYVIDYVRELSRYADVYYLADQEMAGAELAKLAGLAKGAWGVRHGEYDFGSYARLADLVGWDTLERYDELLLVNDSCYLLRPLDEVFARMEAAACDWWGLQATKGIRETRRQPQNQFRDPIPMQIVRTALVDDFERDYVYDFLIGSYFLAYRAPVIRDPEFRRYLASVSTLDKKRHIVKTYEVGLTHLLIQRGHAFDTFASKLYPFHPIFTRWYFRLLDEGFPVLKRYFLAENHYHVPHLREWPELVKRVVPTVDIGVIQRNLERVTDPEKLRRSLDLGSVRGVEDRPVPDTLLSPAAFAEADRLSPKHPSWWAFPVDDVTGAFSGNVRALFEQVKDDPTIHKIVLTRDRAVEVEGADVEVVALRTPAGQHRLMRAGTVLIQRERDASVVHPVAGDLHNLIVLPDDVSFARTGYAAAGREALDRLAEDRAGYRAVISSSAVDSLAVTVASYPLTVHQVWSTGLPRSDLIRCDESDLPPDLRAELGGLRTLVGGRRLLLFVPETRDQPPGGNYRFSREETTWLRGWLEANNCVLGIREPEVDSDASYLSQLSALDVLDLSTRQHPHVELLYRVSSALLTDYSSAFIDFLLTDRPVVSFASDLDSFRFGSGSYYDLDLVFPGPICRTFADLQGALDTLFGQQRDPTYEWARMLFFDHVDDQSAARVVAKIRDLTSVYGIGKSPDERVA